MPVKNADQKTKVQAIINAPEQHLRAVLKVVCTGDVDTLNRVWGALTMIKTLEGQKRKAKDNAASESSAKRTKLIEDAHHCVRCNKAFLQAENHEKACWHHPGALMTFPPYLLPWILDIVLTLCLDPELEIDYDAPTWEGWNTNALGPMISEENKKEYPEGFVFMCCDKDGTSSGCKLGSHWAADDPRGSPPPPDSEGSGEDDEKEDEEPEVVQISDDSDDDEPEDEDDVTV